MSPVARKRANRGSSPSCIWGGVPMGGPPGEQRFSASRAPTQTRQAYTESLREEPDPCRQRRLEERQVMARWGGQVVLVPLVDGRSTSRLIDSAAAAGA